MTQRMWMVRAGRGGRYFEDFIEQEQVSIGFGEEIGPLEANTSRAEVIDRYRATYPDWTDGKAINAAGQVYRFHAEISPGDEVVTYDSSTRRYVIGRVESGAEWIGEGAEGSQFRREVSWTQRVSRDAISVTTRNTLGAIQTLFLINDEAAAELRSLAVPLDAPSNEAAAAKPPAPPPSASGTTIDELREENIEKAGEFIEDLIAKLDPYELQDLVAGILRAMGYKTRVASRGADRGVDIFASPDGLGLQEPRIFVEVKHRRSTAMGSQELRSFLGGRQAGDRCLYVSTGGFTKDARYEADRSNVPLTLIDLPLLRELLVQNYEELDSETRRLVPLKRVYWPVETDS